MRLPDWLRGLRKKRKWTEEQQVWLDEFSKTSQPSTLGNHFSPSMVMAPYGEDLLKHYEGGVPGGALFVHQLGQPLLGDPHIYQPKVINESAMASTYFTIESEDGMRFMVVGPTETVFETDDRELADLMKERCNSAFDLGVIKGGWNGK